MPGVAVADEDIVKLLDDIGAAAPLQRLLGSAGRVKSVVATAAVTKKLLMEAKIDESAIDVVGFESDP